MKKERQRSKKIPDKWTVRLGSGCLMGTAEDKLEKAIRVIFQRAYNITVSNLTFLYIVVETS